MYHSRAESVYEQSMNMSLNNKQKNGNPNNSSFFNQQEQQEKSTRIKTSQLQRRLKLKTPSISQNRQSQYEFKVPFQIYDSSQTPAVHNGLGNSTFFPKREQSQTSQRFFSLRKNGKPGSKSPGPRLKSRQTSAKSSLSARSNSQQMTPIKKMQKLYQQANAQDKIVTKVKKIKRKQILMNSHIQNNESSIQQNNLSYMKIVEEPSISNIIEANTQRQKNLHIKTDKEQLTSQMSIESPLGNQNKGQKLRQAKTHYNSPQNRNLSPDKTSALVKKQQLAELASQAFQNQRQIAFFAEDQSRKQQQISRLKMQTAQAQSDKIELMRDLAQYENGFTEFCGVRSVLLKMHRRVTEVKQKIETKNTNQGTGQQWMTEQQKEQIFEQLSDLQQLKKERGSIGDVQIHKIFSAGQSQLYLSALNSNRSSGFNQVFNKKKGKKGNGFGNPAKSNMNQQNEEDEQTFTNFKISGITSNLQVNVLNGMIFVTISSSIASKPFKCEIKPIQNKQKSINVDKEIERIVFSIERQDEKSKNYMKVVCLVKDEYRNDNQTQCLIKLNGVPKNRYCELEIKKNSNEPDSYNLQLFIEKNIFSLELEKSLIPDSESLEDFIQSRYVYTQNSQTGKFELRIREECIGMRIPKRKWLRQIESGVYDTQKLTEQDNLGGRPTILKPLDDQLQLILPKDDSQLIVESESEDSLDSSSFNDKQKVNKQPKEIIIEMAAGANNTNAASKQVAMCDDFSSIKEVDSESMQEETKRQSKRASLLEQVQYEIKVANQQELLLRQEMNGGDAERLLTLNFKNTKKYHSEIFEKDKFISAVDLAQIITDQKSKGYMIEEPQSPQNIISEKQEQIPIQKPIIIPSLEDSQLSNHEFFYFYRWKVNNIEYQKYIRQKQADEEKRKEIELQMKKQIQQKAEWNHDLEQVDRIKQTAYEYRCFFRGPTNFSQYTTPLLQQQEIAHSSDQQSKLLLYFYASGLDELHILIFKHTSGETLQSENNQHISRQEQQKQSTSFDTMEINQAFLDKIQLLTFQDLASVKDKMLQFSGYEGLQYIIQTLISVIEFERKQYKSMDQNQNNDERLNTQNQNSIRKMQSAIQGGGSQVTYGDKSSSVYDDGTSVNDSYYNR